MKYWIQKHDFSADDFEAKSIEEIIEAFENFDWAKELASVSDEGDKNCPPGLGVRTSDCILHICPVDKTTVFFNYTYTVAGKILGLFNRIKDQTHYVPKYPVNEVPNLLRLYATSRQNEILAIS